MWFVLLLLLLSILVLLLSSNLARCGWSIVRRLPFRPVLRRLYSIARPDDIAFECDRSRTFVQLQKQSTRVAKVRSIVGLSPEGRGRGVTILAARIVVARRCGKHAGQEDSRLAEVLSGRCSRQCAVIRLEYLAQSLEKRYR